VLPPLGKSTKEDFNPMVHLELGSDDEEQAAEERPTQYEA